MCNPGSMCLAEHGVHICYGIYKNSQYGSNYSNRKECTIQYLTGYHAFLTVLYTIIFYLHIKGELNNILHMWVGGSDSTVINSYGRRRRGATRGSENPLNKYLGGARLTKRSPGGCNYTACCFIIPWDRVPVYAIRISGFLVLKLFGRFTVENICSCHRL
jgi:hypothetical protein